MEADSRDLSRAQRAIRRAIKDGNIPVNSMLTEPYVVYNDELHRVDIKEGDILIEDRVGRHGVAWIHKPDFYITFGWPMAPIIDGQQMSQGVWYTRCTYPISLIIEIDGSIHDKKVKKTAERDRDYRDAGLSHIIVNTAAAEKAREKWPNELYNTILHHVGALEE